MATLTAFQFHLEDLCHATALPADIIIEIVEQGIVDPIGDAPDNWAFNTQMITITKKAFRLHNDLEIDWPGTALAISLIDELELLRAKNLQLQRRLDRFSQENSEAITQEKQQTIRGDDDE